MHIRVMKFGGTSLLSHNHRQAAAACVREALEEGYMPVVVVSAIGRRGSPYATDTLLDLVRNICPNTPPREVALLAGCGEIIAAVLTASTLLHARIPAVTLTGIQAGISTANGYVGATIQSVDTRRLARWLRRGIVPVVAGFQGATASGEVAVLARGGSDTSSTALAYALKAACVNIFTDVPGILTADPQIVPDARLIDTLTFEQALRMACYGAKVIHPDAVWWAMRGSIPVYIHSILDPQRYTRIAADAEAAPSTDRLLGVACKLVEDADHATVTLVGALPQVELPLEEVRATLTAAGVLLARLEVGSGAVTAVVPIEQMAAAARALHQRFLAAQDTLLSYEYAAPLL